VILGINRVLVERDGEFDQEVRQFARKRRHRRLRRRRGSSGCRRRRSMGVGQGRFL
jgi:hypothetical protein